jgi:hypothetical protein
LHEREEETRQLKTMLATLSKEIKGKHEESDDLAQQHPFLALKPDEVVIYQFD